jgi:hypothetical protein
VLASNELTIAITAAIPAFALMGTHVLNLYLCIIYIPRRIDLLSEKLFLAKENSKTWWNTKIKNCIS